MNYETCEPLKPNQQFSIGGDTSLVNYTPQSIMEMYLQISSRHNRNSLTENFFSSKNILFIIEQIAKVVKKLTNGQNIHVPLNDELVQTVLDVASNNVGLTYVPGAVALLNRAVVEHEAMVLYNSLIRRKLWIKYYLKQDRIRVFPRGQLTKQTKGEEIISPSGYMLSSPWSNSRNRNSYLHETEGLCCKDGEYENIYGYLEPKITPPGPERAKQSVYSLGRLAKSPAQCYKDELLAQLQ